MYERPKHTRNVKFRQNLVQNKNIDVQNLENIGPFSYGESICFLQFKIGCFVLLAKICTEVSQKFDNRGNRKIFYRQTKFSLDLLQYRQWN